MERLSTLSQLCTYVVYFAIVMAFLFFCCCFFFLHLLSKVSFVGYQDLQDG